MKAIILGLMLTGFIFGDNLCFFDDSIFESSVEKKYEKEIQGLKRGEYIQCAYVEHEKKGLIVFSYVGKKEDNSNNPYTLSFITVLVDREKNKVLDSVLYKDLYFSSNKNFSFYIDTKSYQNISNKETFGLHVKFTEDRSEAQRVERKYLNYLTLYEVEDKKVNRVLTNFLYKENHEALMNGREELLKYGVFRKSSLSSSFKKHKKGSSYEPLLFGQSFYFDYEDKDEVLNSQWDKSWSVKLEGKTFLYKEGKYEAKGNKTNPIFDLKQIEKNTKKGLKYKRIVLDAMLLEEKIDATNENDYDKIAFNLYEHKRYDTAEMIFEALIKHNEHTLKSYLYLGEMYWRRAKEARDSIVPELKARDCYYYEMKANALEIKATQYHTVYMKNLEKKSSKSFRDRVLKHKKMLKDKVLISDVLYHDASIFKLLDKNMRNDKEIATVAVEHDSINIKYLGSTLRKDWHFVYKLVKEDKSHALRIQFVDESLRKDKAFMDEVSRLNPRNFIYAHKSLKKDKVYIAGILKEAYVFDYVDESVKNDRTFILNLLRNRKMFLLNRENPYLLDKEFALEAASDIRTATYVHKKFYSDPEVMWLFSNHVNYYKKIDETLKNDADFMLALLMKRRYALDIVPKKFRNKRDFLVRKFQNSLSSFKDLNSSYKKDRAFLLDIAKANGLLIEYIDKTFQDDKEIVLFCMKDKGYHESQRLSYVSKRLQDDKDVVLNAVHTDGYNLRYASKRLQSDKDVVLSAVEEDGNALQFASKALKADKEVVFRAMNSYGESLKYADKSLKQDFKMIKLLKRNRRGDALPYVDENLKKTEAYLCLKMKYSYDIRNDYKAYFNNEALMLCAMEFKDSAFNYADKSLKNSRDFILKSVKVNGEVLKHVYKEYQNDKEVIESAIESYGGAILWASDTLQDDKELVLKAVKQNAVALQFLGYKDKLKQDKDVVLAALKKDGMALKQVRASMQNNREYVLTAVQQNGLALQFANNRFKSDKEIALYAVKQNGLAIKYVNMQSREMALLAVKDNWEALDYLNYTFRKDKEIVQEAIKQNPKAINFVSYLLLGDKFLNKTF